MFYYTAFGFNIATELEFPELFISKNHIDIDVHIKVGIAPKFLEDGVTTNPELWVTPDRYLIHFKEVAWYYSENAKSLRLLLLCNAMAAIIHQRKLIPLHASGIISKNGVVLVVGHSGAGKSTTIKALTKRDHKIFTDDVCVLKLLDKKIFATPSYPMMKLWENSFDLLQLGNTNEDHKLKFDINKYGVFFHDEFISEWKPVIKIFNIVKSDEEDEVQIEKQNGIEAFIIIGENTYRNQYVEPMKLNSLHFEMVSSLLKQCDVYKVTRPSYIDSISDVVEIIEKEL
jgi:hypothetical protein